ncbi:MAG TPA: CHRD domain-containing protein [Candidatus Baltobacteraceae bacterium]|jgi:hypothetical protein|nr:CHRD domain-containing protein [Candidatus Baltobacteraceae bacterium]
MNLFRSALATAGLVAVVSGAVCAATPKAVTVTMKALNDSGETGTATLTQETRGVQVVVTLKGAPATAQPTHIHAGNCDNINKAPEYALRDTVDGKSTTLVKGIKLSDLMSGKYAINVHKSANDLPTYVSCGNINQ